MKLRSRSLGISLMLALGACGPSVPGSTPAASATAARPASTATATPSVASIGATAIPTMAAVAVLPGEPWLLYAWLLPGDESKHLFLARPNGSDAHTIAGEIGGSHSAPSWAPDGMHIVFAVRNPADSGGSLWTANADGSGATILFDHGDRCVEAFHPVWSPDGTKLAFVCYIDDETSTIQVLDPATKSIDELVRVEWPEFIDNPPSWSPDAKRIAFDIVRWDSTNTFLDGSLIATVPTDAGPIDRGGPVNRLTGFDSFAAAPSWSPDGVRIAFNTYDIGNMHAIEQASNVYTIHPDGTQTRQLTTDSTDGHLRIGQPRWSSDGSQIWVSVTREWENGPSGAPKSELAWVEPDTGALHELHLEGKGAWLRPTP